MSQYTECTFLERHIVVGYVEVSLLIESKVEQDTRRMIQKFITIHKYDVSPLSGIELRN